MDGGEFEESAFKYKSYRATLAADATCKKLDKNGRLLMTC